MTARSEGGAVQEVIARCYAAFNRRDPEGMPAEQAEEVAHHVNEGAVRHGRSAFAAFLDHMNRCYREKLADLVILTGTDSTREAPEFTVNGTYLETDAGMPEADGQTYRLPGGAFFGLDRGKITRVTTFYSLGTWLTQVGG